MTWTDFGPDGRLKSFGVTFEQHCEGMTPALRGTFEFRAGDTTPPAPWMIGSTPPAPPPPAINAFGPASGPPGTSVTISGTNFTNVTSVTFGGTQAAFSAGSSTLITATVPTVPVTTTVTTTVPVTTTVTTTVPSTTTVTTPGPTTTAPGATTTVTIPGPTPTVTTTTPAPLTPAPTPVDVTAPNTRITSGPAHTTAARRVVFRFVASESPATFQCKLDRGRWQTCRSPKAFKALAPGRHRLLVRATDRAGNVDPTPAWRIFGIRQVTAAK